MLQKLVIPDELAERNLQLWLSLINNLEDWCDKRYTGRGSACWPGVEGSGDARDFVHQVLVLEPRWPALQIINPSTPPWVVEKLPPLKLWEPVNQYCSQVSKSTVCKASITWQTADMYFAAYTISHRCIFCSVGAIAGACRAVAYSGRSLVVPH